MPAHTCYPYVWLQANAQSGCETPTSSNFFCGFESSSGRVRRPHSRTTVDDWAHPADGCSSRHVVMRPSTSVNRRRRRFHDAIYSCAARPRRPSTVRPSCRHCRQPGSSAACDRAVPGRPSYQQGCPARHTRRRRVGQVA